MQFTKDQQRVIDARNKNILVSAAAGSGKTAVLVERIIQMVTDEDNPVDIDKLLGSGLNNDQLGVEVIKLVTKNFNKFRPFLQDIFPELTDEQRHKLSKEVQRNSGMAVFETGIAWFCNCISCIIHKSPQFSDFYRNYIAVSPTIRIIVIYIKQLTFRFENRIFVLCHIAI